MNKTTERAAAGEEKTEEKLGIFTRIRNFAAEAARERSRERGAVIYDLVTICVGLVLARCHILFGAYPLGVAFVAVLPFRVIAAALGAVVGSLSLGGGGVIFAIVTAITVSLRAMISGVDRQEGGEATLFGERLLLRMSSALLGGFVAAVYEVLLGGFTLESILFGVSMVALPPVVTLVISGIFNTGIGLRELIYDRRNIFSMAKKSDAEKYNIVFFQCSALVFLFLTTLALEELELFGVSLAYIFVSFVTLLAAKRFGPLRALAVGFISSVGLSGIYAVAFALAGLGAGLLFSFGLGYALIGGGAALAAWSAYTAGLSGFLGTLPEYMIAATLSVPMLRGIATERDDAAVGEVERCAKDMVGTMALSYRNGYSGALDLLESSLSGIASVIRGSATARELLSHGEYVSVVRDVARECCLGCESRELCEAENVAPAVKRAEEIALILERGGRIRADDLNGDTEFCAVAKELAERINTRVAALEQEKHRHRDTDATADEYDLIAKLINDARLTDAAECTMNSTLTESLTAVMTEAGFGDGVIRAFGERRLHFILAGEDETGDRITSRELHRGIERVAGVRLGAPEYFRRGSMALMECGVERSFAVECATASLAGPGGETSGDTVTAFESSDGHFYALISDGMGQGEIAKETSDLVAKFLTRGLDFGASKDTVMYILNGILRRRGEECSATVDLFDIDLFDGSATFIKSGAAPSFVKRGSSIFRLKSQTAPIGLLRTIDSERIRVEVQGEDYVIMISDGISQSADEAPWLLELLSKPPRRTLKEFADAILAAAVENSRTRDDMSVVVLRIERL